MQKLPMTTIRATPVILHPHSLNQNEIIPMDQLGLVHITQ